MEAFKGKEIILYLNSNTGYLTLAGKYIDSDEDFLVIENNITRKIQYFNKNHIKYIEILREIKADDDELN